MSVSSSDRRNRYTNLETTIGTQATDTLMDLLPLHPSSELVTRSDVHAQTQMLRGEMAQLKGEMVELRAELKGEMAQLKGEMVELRAELKGDGPAEGRDGRAARRAEGRDGRAACRAAR